MIGALADDFTGATDIAAAFRRAGLNVRIQFELEDDDTDLLNSDVTVVALKTRTIEPAEAVAQSLRALDWLRSRGATQIFFKYCSTFDSRPEGNIGPVADALADALGAPRAVFVPSSPRHLRTQYMGHLFVDKLLLSDSHMRHHPLTPMTNSYLPAVLAGQTHHGVTLLEHRDVQRGITQIRRLLEQAETGSPFVLVDALNEADLRLIGSAVVDDILITGAAGLAEGFGSAWAQHHRTQDNDHRRQPDAPPWTTAAVLAGSCSARTLEQVANMQRAGHPSLALDALETPDSAALATTALAWYDQQGTATAPLIYSSLPPKQLAHVQSELGIERASRILETAMGSIARGLVQRGVDRLVVAGGETSGAVVIALDLRNGLIGEEAAPGVPWISMTSPHPLTVLLKSGNFGDPELLTRSVTKVASP